MKVNAKSCAASGMLFLLVIALSPSLCTCSLTNPRTPAEFEEVKGVVVSWFEEQYLNILSIVDEHGGWTTPLREDYEGLMNTQATIIREALNEGIEAYVLDDTSHTMIGGYYYSDYRVQDTLAAMGISSPRLHVVLINGQPPRSVWSRDWGPYGVYKNQVDSAYAAGLAFNQVIAGYLGRPLAITPVMDGGNFLTDGHGTLFCDSNAGISIDQGLFGISEVETVANYKIHIDYYMKMINEETFIVNEVPPSNYMPPLDWFFGDNAVLDAVIAKVSQRPSCYGRPYRFIRIPTAPTYDDGSVTVFTSEASYANSLIINRTVLVPMFEYAPENDSLALEIYRESMPGYRVVGVPAKHFAGYGGTIHCITREVCADDPIFIAHAWYPDTVAYAAGYSVTAAIQTKSGVASAALYWTDNPASGYQFTTMVNTGGDNFEASIPGMPCGSQVSYYISATANGGKTATKPLVGAAGAYTFLIEGTAGVGDAWQEPLLIRNYPNPFSVSTSVDFVLPSEQQVAVRVYSVSGEMVRELLNDREPAGRHSLEWDRRGSSGSPVSPGVYLLAIEVAATRITRKAVVVN